MSVHHRSSQSDGSGFHEIATVHLVLQYFGFQLRRGIILQRIGPSKRREVVTWHGTSASSVEPRATSDCVVIPASVRPAHSFRGLVPARKRIRADESND